jgi:hypothetical protein
MKMLYTVHSAVQERVPVKAQLHGVDVDAHVPGLTVELIGGDAEHGHTFRFVPRDAADLAAHVALFQPGARVQAEFSPVTE